MTAEKQTVLIGVIKRKKDLDILLKERWYRIPKDHLPVRKASWLAVYQTSDFRKEGRCIRYYAPILGQSEISRSRLLADEQDHPRAQEAYIKLRLGPVHRLVRKITNRTGMKIVFAFTTLVRLRRSRFIHTLLRNKPLEPMMGRVLRKAGIKASAEFPVSFKKGIYRLDFAVFCRKGNIDIECDGLKSHSTVSQKNKDSLRDRFMKSRGWTVLRFIPDDILKFSANSIRMIRKTIDHLGGIQAD